MKSVISLEYAKKNKWLSFPPEEVNIKPIRDLVHVIYQFCANCPYNSGERCPGYNTDPNNPIPNSKLVYNAPYCELLEVHKKYHFKFKVDEGRGKK